MRLDQDGNEPQAEETLDDFEAEFAAMTSEAPEDEPQPEPQPEPEDAPMDSEELPADDGEDDDAQGDDPDEPDAEEDSPEDPVAALEAAKAEIQELQHRANSNAGRIAAYQRQIATLSAPKPEKAEEEEKGPEDPDLVAFREEYPEVAGPMDKLRQRDAEKIASLERQISALTEDQAARAVASQEDFLTRQHGDWLDVVGSEDFMEWVSKQPKFIHDAALRNGERIVDGEEAATVVSLYKAFNRQNEPEPQPSAASQKTADKRKRQLKSAATVPQGDAGSTTGVPEDFEAAFNFYASEG